MRDIEDLIDDLDHAMRFLRRKIRGVPSEEQGFKAAHDRLRRDVALLLMSLEETVRAVEAQR